MAASYRMGPALVLPSPRLGSLRAGVVTLALLCLTAQALLGQGQAVLSGIVGDENGHRMPGVTVTAASPSGAVPPVGAVTDAKGRYRIAPLPPRGDYVVVAEIPGYARVEIGPVDLDPGKTTKLDITMVPSSETTETVTVVAQGDMVDLDTTRTSTVFNSEFIEGLPLLGRQYQDILTLAPGVTDVDGDGNPNVNGARATELQTLFDGANTTDPLTGGFGQELNLEAIVEIEVITTGASAEFGRAQGGFANIITRSGGNDFEGSFKFFLRSDLLDNDGANNNDTTNADLFSAIDSFDDIRPFLTVGGPLVRDRLWYFVALEHISVEIPVNAIDNAFLQTQEGWNNFGKLTWQINPGNRVSFQLNYDPQRWEGLARGTGIAAESDAYLDIGGVTGTLRWTNTLSPGLLLEALVSRFDTEFDVLPVADPDPCPERGTDDEGECRLLSQDLYTITGDRIFGPYPVTHRDDRRRDEVRVDLSIFADTSWGTHNIKTGVGASRESYRNDFARARIRTENFGRPSGILDTGPGDLGGTFSFSENVPPELLRRADKDAFGLYVQDSFRPLPNLSIQVGMRYDREELEADGFTFFDPMQEAQAFLQLLSVGTGTPVEDLDFSTAVADTDKIRYDINGDGLDTEHCGTLRQLDRYTNSLVTGFVVHADGTYSLVGDEGFDKPDHLADNFFVFRDNGGEPSCSGGARSGLACETMDDCPPLDPTSPFFHACLAQQDQVASFDPSLAGQVLTEPGRNYGDPGTGDTVMFYPRGTSAELDGRAVNPNCDRLQEDAVVLFSVFRRHEAGTEDARRDPVQVAQTGEGPRYLGVSREPEIFTVTSDNLAPRLSISWDPWADNRTKLFASWSRLYGTLHLQTLLPEIGPSLRSVVYDGLDLLTAEDDEDVEPLTVGRFSVNQVDRDLETPFTDEFTVGFERELAPNWLLSLRYIHREGRNQLQDQSVNHFVQDADGDGLLDDRIGLIARCGPESGCNGVIQIGDGFPDLFAINPFFAQVLRVGNFNSSEYDSYQLVVTRRLSRQWQMNASYTYSAAVGNAETFDSVLGDDLGFTEEEFGPLNYDQRHVVKFSGVTFLAGDQSLGASIQWASGLPFSILQQGTSLDSYQSPFFRRRYPTGQRNSERNEGVWQIDTNYRKSFTWKATHASLGLEIENLTNSDDLRIFSVNHESFLGNEIARRFGRRFQISLQMHF